jgi:hypothetical protein
MSPPYDPPPPATTRTRFLLLAAWGALTVAALAFVLGLGSNVPSADEWEFVPVLTGHEPSLPWLWAQHNEHRLPLPRLVYLTLFRLTNDFRAGMVLQVALLSALSLWLMRLAARLRGGPHWADVFFPVSLLHAGHWENLLMGYQLCFTLFAVLATATGAVALRTTRETAFRSGVAAGVLALLLALTGGSGLVVALPVCAWVGYLGAMVWRTGAKRRAAILFLLALLPVAYLGLYFDGYTRPPGHPSPGDGGIAVVMVTAETLAVAFGIGVAGVWWAAFGGIAALGVVVFGMLVEKLKSPATRPAAVGLLAFIAGIVGLALAIGVGRAGLGDDMGLWSRYTLLTWPLLGVAYLFWVARGGRGGKWVPVALCVAAALAFLPNTGTGVRAGSEIRAALAAVEADAATGASPERIAARLRGTYHGGQEERAVRGIPMLREAGVGAFGASGSSLWWFGGGLVGLAVALAAGRWVRNLGRAVQVERARELFRLQHERFEEMLLTAARATGKPRGLAWVGCAITGDAVLARDTASRGIVALVPVEIRFEPVAGGDMEDVPAATEPRPATAVYTFHKGHWHTDGRVVFNLDPHQAVAHFGKHFVEIGHHH